MLHCMLLYFTILYYTNYVRSCCVSCYLYHMLTYIHTYVLLYYFLFSYNISVVMHVWGSVATGSFPLSGRGTLRHPGFLGVGSPTQSLDVVRRVKRTKRRRRRSWRHGFWTRQVLGGITLMVGTSHGEAFEAREQIIIVAALDEQPSHDRCGQGYRRQLVLVAMSCFWTFTDCISVPVSIAAGVCLQDSEEEDEEDDEDSWNCRVE